MPEITKVYLIIKDYLDKKECDKKDRFEKERVKVLKA